MTKLVALVAILGLAGRADADVGAYAEAGVWVGYIGATAQETNGPKENIGTGVAMARVAAGVRGGSDDGLQVAGGVALDGYAGEYGISLGLELRADHALSDGWRVGPRLAAGIGNGGGYSVIDGQIVFAGVRARRGEMSLGIDLVLTRGGEGGLRTAGTGVILGIDATGRKGAIGAATAVGAGALSLLVVVLIFSQANIH